MLNLPNFRPRMGILFKGSEIGNADFVQIMLKKWPKKIIIAFIKKTIIF